MTQREFSNIGEFVKKHRIKQGYSQEALSKALGYANGQFISNVERGLCSIPLKHVVPLRQVLGVEAHQITKALLKDYEQTIQNYTVTGEEVFQESSPH